MKAMMKARSIYMTLVLFSINKDGINFGVRATAWNGFNP